MEVIAMKRLVLPVGLVLLLAANTLPLSAGAPPLDWVKTYPDTGAQVAYWIEECSSGGYIVAGHTEDVACGTLDVLLMRLDQEGDTLWVKTYGDSLDEAATCVRETGTGFILVGYRETSANSRDAYILRTDADGDTLWTRTHDFGGADLLYCTETLPDGSLISVGYTSGLGAPDHTDALILKTDANGHGIWKQYYVGAGNDRGIEITKTADGDCVMVGFTEDASGDSDILLMRFESTGGDSIWTRTFGDTTRDLGSAVCETVSGDIIAGGGLLDYSQGWSKAYLVRTDADGDSIWSRTYGDTSGDQYIYSVTETSDLGLVWCGRADTAGTGDSDFLFVKTDSHGDTVWTRMAGDGDHQSPVCMTPTMEGGFIAAGYTRTLPLQNHDVYIVKMKADVAGIKIPERDFRDALLELRGPNPSMESVTVSYHVLRTGNVRLAVYDVAGRRLATLKNGMMERGSYRVRWDCVDDSGGPVPAGLYFVRFTSDGESAVRKVLVIR
jgi:hypothetical protein